MAEANNKYQEIMDKLKQDGKVTVLNRDEDLKAMDAMNKSTERTKEEYQIKEMNSQLAAAQVVLR